LIYSPELHATQQEYLLALRASRSLGPSGVASAAQGGRDLLDAARQRLILWEITPADIERIVLRAMAKDPVRRYDSARAVADDLDRGFAHVRQMDPGFDLARFGETASDVFFRLQGAWMTRDMGGVRASVTEEMSKTLQSQCDRLRAERRVNRLENIAVRSVEVTETWQEEGHDFVTVRFLANLLDYTTDESGTQLVEGSRTEPVKFEEFWTFTRPVGPGAWRLSAIQQG